MTTLFQERIFRGDIEFVKMRISKNEQIYLRDFLISIKSQNLGMIKLLLANIDAGVRRYAMGPYFSFEIFKEGNIEMIEYFRDNTNILIQPPNLMWLICHSRYSTEFFKYILDECLYIPLSDSHDDYRMILERAIEESFDTDIIFLIYEQFPSKFDMLPLIPAVLVYGDESIWDYLYGNMKITRNTIMPYGGTLDVVDCINFYMVVNDIKEMPKNLINMMAYALD